MRRRQPTLLVQGSRDVEVRGDGCRPAGGAEAFHFEQGTAVTSSRSSARSTSRAAVGGGRVAVAPPKFSIVSKQLGPYAHPAHPQRMADHYQPYPTDYSQQGPSDYGGDQSRGGGRGGRGRTRSRRGRQQDGGDNYGGMRAEFARETGGDTQEGGYGGGGEEYGGRDGGQGRGRGRGRGRGGRRRSASPDYGRGGDEGDRRGRDQWEGDGEYGGRANDRGGRGSREGRRAGESLSLLDSALDLVEGGW